MRNVCSNFLLRKPVALLLGITIGFIFGTTSEGSLECKYFAHYDSDENVLNVGVFEPLKYQVYSDDQELTISGYMTLDASDYILFPGATFSVTGEVEIFRLQWEAIENPLVPEHPSIEFRPVRVKTLAVTSTFQVNLANVGYDHQGNPFLIVSFSVQYEHSKLWKVNEVYELYGKPDGGSWSGFIVVDNSIPLFGGPPFENAPLGGGSQ